MNMGKFSMFKDIEDLEEKREHYNGSEYDIEPDFNNCRLRIYYDYKRERLLNLLHVNGSKNIYELQNPKKPKTVYKYNFWKNNEEVLKKVIDIDVFLWINYTCDYLISINDITTVRETDLEDIDFIDLLYNIANKKEDIASDTNKKNKSNAKGKKIENNEKKRRKN